MPSVLIRIIDGILDRCCTLSSDRRRTWALASTPSVSSFLYLLMHLFFHTSCTRVICCQLADSLHLLGSRILPHLQKLESMDTSSKAENNDAIGPSTAKAPVKEPLNIQSPVQPGLSLPQDFPPLAAPSRPAPTARKPTQNAASNIKPVVPVLPTSRPQASAAAKEGQNDPTPEQQPVGKSKAKDPSDSSPNIKETKDSTTTDETSRQSKTDNDKSSSSDATIRAVDLNPVLVTPRKSTEKRPLPESFDIAAAKDSSKKRPPSITTSTKAQGSMAPFASSRRTNESTDSQPDTPTKVTPQPSQSVRSNKSQPPTLRVGPTPKTDNSSKAAMASPTVPESATIPSTKVLSRRPSLTSVQGLGTPVSDKASDNASFTSTSLSRANSPPPSAVGTAPVRQNTKNQQKKERRARAQQIEKSKADEEPVKAVIEEPVVQPPIIGRKKKAKKITASRETADSTPSVTRPSSPTPQGEVVEEKAPSQPATPIKEPKKSSKRETPKAERGDPAKPDSSVKPAASEAPKPPNTVLAACFLSLVMRNEIPLTTENLFKTVPGVNYRPDITLADLEENDVPTLTAEQQQLHEKGEAVLIEPKKKRPFVMMPDKKTMRFLNKEAAKRFMELRLKVIDLPEEYRWMPLRADDVEKFQLHRRTVPVEPSASIVDERLDQMVNRFSDSNETLQQQTQPYSPSPWPAPFIDEYKYGAGALAGPETETGFASGDKGKDKEVDSPESIMQTLAKIEEKLARSKKETEAAEKKLNAVIKKNRKAVLGGGN